MGKRKQENELQEYLDYLGEHQAHQYSRGYWFGRVRKGYPTPKGDKLYAPIWIINGGSFIVAAVLVVVFGFCDYGLSWELWSSFLLSGFFCFWGYCLFWPGLGILEGARRSRE